MPGIDSHQAFQKALSDLPVKKQRQVGAKFIGHVLDLTSERRLHSAQAFLTRPNISAEELLDAYHSVHSLYVETNPRSDLSELNYARQAEHFVAEACLACLSPVYEEAKVQRLGEKVAMYCRMARTCAGIKHDQDRPHLSEAEQLLTKEIQDQYRLLDEFLEGR